MRRRVILLELAAILFAGIAVWRSPRSQAQQGTVVIEDSPDVVRWEQLLHPEEQHAQIYLGHGYVVGGIELEAGKYLVVHRTDRDDEAKDCLFVYRMPYHRGDEAVAAAHCMPVEGPVAQDFTMRSTEQPDGSSLVRSIQFVGSMQVHTFAAHG